MREHLDTLLAMAREAHGEHITPASGKPWRECVTETKNSVLLWYNDSVGSTGIVAIDKATKKQKKFDKKGG